MSEDSTYLVLGATGATGRHVAAELLDAGRKVKVVVRNKAGLPAKVRDHRHASSHLTVIETSLLSMGDEDMLRLVHDVDGIAQCLGHNMSFQGMFGEPKMLCTDSVRRLCEAWMKLPPTSDKETGRKRRYVLMNTAGNVNPDAGQADQRSWTQRAAVGIIRQLIPPHHDNEQAAEYLRTKIGKDHRLIEWVVVRPDTLVDQDAPTPYELYSSPTRDCLVDSGTTSRNNCGHFMAHLLLSSAPSLVTYPCEAAQGLAMATRGRGDELWSQWRHQMPVIYNKGFGYQQGPPPPWYRQPSKWFLIACLSLSAYYFLLGGGSKFLFRR